MEGQEGLGVTAPGSRSIAWKNLCFHAERHKKKQVGYRINSTLTIWFSRCVYKSENDIITRCLILESYIHRHSFFQV